MAPDQPDRSVRVDAADNCLRGRFSAMASPCELLVETTDKSEAERLTGIVAAEAWRIEEKFSRYLDGNVIDRINNANGEKVEVDDETAQLIDFSVTLYDLSDGTFDVTSGALRHVWRFDGGNKLPTRRSLEEVMRHVGWHHVEWHSPFLTMRRGMEMDLGGMGKEYAADRCASLIKKTTTAACLVNLGGDLVATGAPHNRDHWKVGIESVAPGEVGPESNQVLSLRIGALATSGDARRFLLHDGVRYSHILDPKTGWPVPDAPRSITVAADTCTQAGMLSTLAMLKGAQAEDFLDAQGVLFWCNRGTTP